MNRHAGVDEAGRGALAGPVVVAAVILDPDNPITGLTDSKALTARRREQLADAIRQSAASWKIVAIQPDKIDQINILQASLLGMQRAVAGLSIKPDLVLVDGNRAPAFDMPARAIIKGDLLEPAISAASILAKVHRDQLMTKMEQRFPGYGFARHKGYPTRQHRQSLQQLGPCPQHRRSYAPVIQACLKFPDN